MKRTVAGGSVITALCLAVGIAGGGEQPPRTLVLALDGLSYRTFESARTLGAFEGWPEAVPMVSTFPSVTNVAFTALLHRFGAEPAEGYEVSRNISTPGEISAI